MHSISNDCKALDLLDNFQVDWSDFRKASQSTRALARRIGDDKKALGQLLMRAYHDENLSAEAESHQLLDRILLYKADERGFRVRLHVSTQETYDRPHDHRFSFSTYILNGSYINRLFELDHSCYENEASGRILHQDRFHPDNGVSIPPGKFKLLALTKESPGSSYSFHHTSIHSVKTDLDTVSLFIRGPSEKDHSLVFDKEQQIVWWRFSSQKEPEDRRQKVVMRKEKFEEIIRRMRSIGVIV